MRLPQPLYSGHLIKRYKRFLADVRLENGDLITAHCADPGRLPGLAVEGAPVWLSKSDDPKRKLPYRLEVIEQAGNLVGLNTNNANKLAHEAIAGGLPSDFAGATTIRREVKYGDNTRFDFQLEFKGSDPLWLEIKNVTWRCSKQGELAFPDAVTARGAKHLDHLADIAKAGGRAALMFVAQRRDCTRLRIADEIDPKYAHSFLAAKQAGVAMMALDCDVDLTQIICRQEIEIDELRL